MAKKSIFKGNMEQIDSYFKYIDSSLSALHKLSTFIKDREQYGWKYGDVFVYYNLLVKIQENDIGDALGYQPAYDVFVECGLTNDILIRYSTLCEIAIANTNWIENLSHIDDSLLTAIKNSVSQIKYQMEYQIPGLTKEVLNVAEKYRELREMK